MNPTFTIIIPTYNRAHLISKAIQSVLAQTVRDWELIIVDDGSTDRTKEVVFSFADHRIKYGYQKNKGRSIARNVGLHHASGEWVCFLDSDDWYLENHLEVFQEAIAKYPDFNVFKTGVSFENERGKKIFKSEFHNNKSDIIPFIVMNYCSVLDLCIKTGYAKGIQFPDIESWEDKAYLCKLIQQLPWKQLPYRTVIQLEHQGRGILNNFQNTEEVNKTLIIMEQSLSDATLRDKLLGKVQQNHLLTTMTNAHEMGLDLSEINILMRKINKNVLPMTWIRFFKVLIFG